MCSKLRLIIKGLQLFTTTFNLFCLTFLYIIFHVLLKFNDNKLDNWKDLDQLKNATDLATVYFERNPIAKDPRYRSKVKLALPKLQQIDATYCQTG